MKKITCVLVLLLAYNFNFGQTVLAAGDIAITGANADDPDEFSFVLLTDIVTTTTINFTDNGWRIAPDLDFRPGEGTLTWTATTDLACGTEIIITDNSPFSATVGTVTDDALFDLRDTGGGDQIIAYQGLASSPVFLYAIKFAGGATNAWALTAIDDQTSAIPTGLVDGTNALSRNADNVIYDCSQTNGPAFILAAVTTGGNWTGSNAVRQTMPNCGFGCEVAMLTFNFTTGGVSTTLGVAPNAVPEPSNYNDPGLQASTIIRGPGLVPDPETNGYSSTGFIVEDTMISSAANINAAVAADDYYEFTVTPQECNLFDVTSIQFKLGRNPSGSKELALRSSIDGYTANLGGIIPGPTVNNSSEYFIFTFSQTTNSDTVTYRIYSYDIGGPNPGQTRFKSTGAVLPNSIEVHGRAYDRTSTWNGTTWDVAPTISRKAILNDDYDTSTNGNFSACSLIIDNGAILNIADNTYVEVENDVDVDDGEINVQNHGAFVQNNDSATFTLGGSGNSTVRKETNTLSKWFEYTYWGSPVTNTTAGAALSTSDWRFWFNANNYLDAFQESGNDNTLVAGSDDIDDNNDDWQALASGTTLTPGVGYAATHTRTGFSPGTAYNYNFEGPFNNGIVTSTIYYNAANVGDHWNLIGNPYPCAIDFNDFHTLNSGVVGGAAYLWSHNTAASNSTNGNQGYNFAQTDYAIISAGSGNTAGGDGIIPNDFIPSGQGFFIAGIANGSVTFNNSMREDNGTSNSQFFKNSSTKSKSNTSQSNKLWVNLTSDNGIFNQILVAYVNGATNGFDGMAYDAPRNLSSGVASIIYTKINGEEDKKYAIQGKKPNSITKDEVIPLGFYTSINTPTNYKLSIEKLQGEFLTNNSVYLKDKLLNKEHNLSNSDYPFTSEVGEFNSRFEIVFNANSLLSTDELTANPNDINIIELEDNNVKFSTKNSTLKSIVIFDLLGKELYNLAGSSNSEYFTLNNLQSSVYIARVLLANGTSITKKFSIK